MYRGRLPGVAGFTARAFCGRELFVQNCSYMEIIDSCGGNGAVPTAVADLVNLCRNYNICCQPEKAVETLTVSASVLRPQRPRGGAGPDRRNFSCRRCWRADRRS